MIELLPERQRLMRAHPSPPALVGIVAVALAASAFAAGPVAPAAVGPSISIDAAAGRHPINPDIYGINFAEESLASELRLPVRRWGGNSTTRYNWRADVHNTGSDWYFENIPEDNPNPQRLPLDSAADRFVEQDRRTQTRTIMTVPLIGWVPSRRLPGHPYDCGFKVSRYGPQQSTDTWDADCGNGVRADGTAITGNDPRDTSTAVGPDFVRDWVAHLVARYGDAGHGGVAYFDLDNEPMLWNSTHRDVHPAPTSYDELRDRTVAYAAAVKGADPTAKTLGPVLWGWVAYFYSALDVAAGGNWWDTRPDRRAHGDQPFVEWYLRQMQAYELQRGARILDYLDLHFYPEGVALRSAGDAARQAWRLRSTRLLWDAGYVEETWIAGPVYLIPRMRAWADAYYPGTKLAITEYNWGGQESINGALAQADVLGIFGREGLDMAALWSAPKGGDPGEFAFRVFRNYDGAGHAFGETSVSATSTNQSALSAYAALRAGDGALTVVVINKTAAPLTSNVVLAGLSPGPSAQVYQYGPAALGTITHGPDQAIDAGGLAMTFPASSITLLVIPQSAPPASGPRLRRHLRPAGHEQRSLRHPGPGRRVVEGSETGADGDRPP